MIPEPSARVVLILSSETLLFVNLIYRRSNTDAVVLVVDGWMDLLSGTGVATALRNVQWPKPFHTPAQPLRLGWLFQRTKPLQGYNC